MSKIGFQNPLPEIQRMCLQKMYPRTLFIIFLSSELHAGPYETKHNIFLIQKRSQKFAFRSTIFFIQKGHFGPLWPSQKLIFTNYRIFFKITYEKLSKFAFRNTLSQAPSPENSHSRACQRFQIIFVKEKNWTYKIWRSSSSDYNIFIF